MEIEQLPLGALGTNCYLIEDQKDTLIIDPGGDADKLIRMIERRELKPQAILLTHAHFDHIGALDHVRDHFNIPVYIHEEEKDWLGDPDKNGSSFFSMVVSPVQARPADHFIEPGDMTIGRFSFEVRHTPGHSPGSVSFVFRDQVFVIAGDTLFEGGIGRTDLPGGHHELLLESIRNELLSLGGDMEVCPGHGGMTTIEKEELSNPFL